MDKPNFEVMTDTEMNRWIAERDGWTVIAIGEAETLGNGDRYGLFEVRHNGEFFGSYEYESDAWLAMPQYTESADAALALAERWGITIMKLAPNPVGRGWIAQVLAGNQVFLSIAAPTLSRALCNALCAAKWEKEKGLANG